MRRNAIITRVLRSKLKKYRRSAKMTQEDLAEKVNLSRAYIGYIEQGRNVPSLETLEKIAKALRVKLSDLF
ncbi:MAG TPA: transcriptional regulator [Candidatus Zambryskibacteria bacterium]|nr:transcriptional regulator [Candidatus Zambryskibacteria bacterium]